MGDLRGGSGSFTVPAFVGALVWLLPAGTVYWVLAATGVTDGDILRYAAYFAGGVVLP